MPAPCPTVPTIMAVGEAAGEGVVEAAAAAGQAAEVGASRDGGTPNGGLSVSDRWQLRCHSLTLTFLIFTFM